MALLTKIKGNSDVRIDAIKKNLSGDNYFKLVYDEVKASLNAERKRINLQLNDNELTIEYDGYDSNFIILDIPRLKKLIPGLEIINFNNPKSMLYVYFNYDDGTYTIDNMTFKSEVPDNGKDTTVRGRIEFRLMIKNNQLIPNFDKNCQFVSNNIMDFMFIESFNIKDMTCKSFSIKNNIKNIKPIKQFIELHKHHLFSKHNKYSVEDTFYSFRFISNDYEFIDQLVKELDVKKEQIIR